MTCQQAYNPWLVLPQEPDVCPDYQQVVIRLGGLPTELNRNQIPACNVDTDNDPNN